MNVVLCVICGKLVPESDVAEHACCKAQDECDCGHAGCPTCDRKAAEDGPSGDDGRDFSPPYEP
jgi:hypothetical protein